MPKTIHAGFSLVDVMLALSVLAICVGAVMTIQLSNLHTARHSAARNYAVQIAAEIADWLRMEAASESASGAALSLAAFGETAGEPDVSCRRIACTPSQMQTFEMYGWQRRIKERLPGARLVVCRDGQPWDAAARRWRWACDASDPSTAPIVIKIGWPEQAAITGFLPVVTATVGLIP